MKNYNDDVLQKLDLISLTSKGIEFEHQVILESYLVKLKEHIDEADYLSFQMDGFLALKILIKLKRYLLKTLPESEQVNSTNILIHDLRKLLQENERVIGFILRAESMSHNVPLMATTLLTCLIVCALLGFFFLYY
ncbi:TPA: hypothetical protein MEA92_005122 [Klebsiella aerogenes]|uniref:hypothetical protein n=1 Tax=Enterobacteriaceae TaxID=543 RepID=UPI0005F0302C|nr:hypothetical protein [Klebsiella aerogenes]KJO59153.1 hypothetical protein SR89_09965 [Klebsiella aerogenes]HBV9946231.1 hypothetical protein [Klebsiella aerogenes]